VGDRGHAFQILGADLSEERNSREQSSSVLRSAGSKILACHLTAS